MDEQGRIWWVCPKCKLRRSARQPLDGKLRCSVCSFAKVYDPDERTVSRKKRRFTPPA